MELPDLDRIIETHVLVDGSAQFLEQVRRDVLPHIRDLQANGHLRWFCFLQHPACLVWGGDQTDSRLVIQIRLEPAAGLDPDEFRRLLPPVFVRPHHEPRDHTVIGDMNAAALSDGDWAHAWRIMGQASELVLSLLDGITKEHTGQEVFRFLHYLASSLGMGGQCLYIGGLQRF